MSKNTITKHEYHQLVGLLKLARDHSNTVDDCIRSAESLLGAEDNLGSHFADAVFGYPARDLDEVLDRMDVEVEE